MLTRIATYSKPSTILVWLNGSKINRLESFGDSS